MCATKLSSRKDAMPFLRNSFTTPLIENILVYDVGRLTSNKSSRSPSIYLNLVNTYQVTRCILIFDLTFFHCAFLETMDKYYPVLIFLSLLLADFPSP